jgi:hypothetical protein
MEGAVAVIGEQLPQEAIDIDIKSRALPKKREREREREGEVTRR